MKLQCTNCGREYPSTTRFGCRRCDYILQAVYDEPLSHRRIEAGKTMFEKYGHRLPSLGSAAGDEGNTPLLRADALADILDVPATVYLKDERRNPTGSFKDRAFAPVISLAAETGEETVMTASTGNSAAACARYAAQAGLNCALLVEAATPPKKLLEPCVYGADVVRVSDLFTGSEASLKRLLSDVAEQLDSYLAFAYQPFNAVLAEGVKTISYEVIEQLNWTAPDIVITATGGGDNLAAQYRGFQEAQNAGFISKIPKMVAAQAIGAAPLAMAVDADETTPATIDTPSTVASGITTPFAGQHGLDAIYESDGTAIGVEDEELLDGVMALTQSVGVWPEPASATVVPTLARLAAREEVNEDDIIVLTITGSGHKHTEPVEAQLADVLTVARDPDAIAEGFTDIST